MKTFTEEQVEILKKVWEEALKVREQYYESIGILEKQAQVYTGIEIELFHSEFGLCGIGDYNREYKLLQEEQLS